MTDLAWLGLTIGSRWGWTPTAREGWAIAITCLVMTLVASLIVSRVVRFIIAIGVIMGLLSIGALTTIPG